jgi:hypothetical protein
MSQSLQNQMTLAKSMNSIITLDDGAGTTITNGTINSNDIFSNTISSNSLTANDLDLNGSLTLEVYNDITVSTTGGSQLVSLYEKGKSYFEQDVHMNRAYSYNTPTTGYEVVNKAYVDSRTPIYAQITTITVLPFTNFPTLIELINPASPPPSFYVSLPDARYIPIGSQLTFFSRGVPPLSNRLGIKGRTVNQVIQNAYGVVNQFVYFEPYMNSMTFVCISNTLSTTEPMYMVIEFNYDFREVFVNHSTTSNPSQDNYMFNTWHNFNTFQNDAGGVALQIASGSDFQLLGEMSVDGLNITPVELAYLSGVTSPIQSQLDLCVSTSGDNTFTGTNTFENEVTLQANANFNFIANALSLVIPNQYFQTPVQSNNSSTNYTAPYTAITDWTFSTPSPAVTLIVSRGNTAFNSSTSIFPIPSRTQYLTARFTSGPSTIDISQPITFTETGNYILQFYTLGPLNLFNSLEQTITASIAGRTLLATTTESVFALQKLRFNISDTSIPYTLLFTATSTTPIPTPPVYYAITLYAVEIKKCIGVNVSDGSSLTNYQQISQDGITTSDLYCRGNFNMFGSAKFFGTLEPYNRYSSATQVISNSIFGTQSTHSGIRNTIMGVNSAKNAVHLTESIIHGFDCFANAGFTAGGANANSKILAIGNRALRAFNCIAGTSNLQNLFIGHDAGATLNYPAATTPNIHQFNCVVGSETFKRAGSTNLQYNAFFGHNIMGTTTTASLSTIQFNSVFGNNSFLIARGASNTSCGYNNFNLATNTATNNNTFLGANVCNTQSGASNVMTNCTFIGSNTDVTIASNYSNSTCLGYNSRIEFSNGIFLGTINEMTYANGGLNLPVTTNLELNGNILANLTTITPLKLSFLDQVTANKLPSLAIEDMATRTPSLASACSFFGNLAGNTQITTTTTGVHNSGFGTGALKDNDAGSYNTAVGSKSGFIHDTGDYCTYVGYFAGGANTASNVTIVGANSCTTQTSIANATVIGQGNSVADGNTNAIILGQGNSISGNDCGIIGYGITNNTANRIHIGNATQTVYIQNDLIVQDVLQTIGELRPASILHKKYYASAVNPTVLTAVTMSAPLYEFNRVNITAGTFSLPLSSEVEIGTVLRFRRITTLTGAVTVQVQTGSGQAILARNSISTVTSTPLMVQGVTYSSIIFLDTNLWAVMD